MDWTPEMDEVYTLMNRIRQVICKVNPAAYSKFMADCDKEPEREQFIKVFVGAFVLQLHQDGWFNIFDMINEEKPVQVFDAKMVQNQPNFTWDAHVIRTRVVPAIARDMVLDDLSLL